MRAIVRALLDANDALNEEEATVPERLPITRATVHGENDYTAAGQAEADLSSAMQALEDVLGRSDLSPAQRRDFAAALKRTRMAWRAVMRHVDLGGGDRA